MYVYVTSMSMQDLVSVCIIYYKLCIMQIYIMCSCVDMDS